MTLDPPDVFAVGDRWAWVIPCVVEGEPYRLTGGTRYPTEASARRYAERVVAWIESGRWW